MTYYEVTITTASGSDTLLVSARRVADRLSALARAKGASVLVVERSAPAPTTEADAIRLVKALLD